MSKETFCDGTPCDLFIDGYCTDLDPKEIGCVGKEHCQRFEGQFMEDENEKLKQRIAEIEEQVQALEANNAQLREALEPFARFHCSPSGECECHNCQARDVLQRTPADSLAAVRREAMEKMREECLIACENAYPYTEISSIDIEGLLND